MSPFCRECGQELKQSPARKNQGTQRTPTDRVHGGMGSGREKPQRVLDVMGAEAFVQLLTDAELNAADDWSVKFTEGIRENFDKYGDKSFISDKQLDILN